MHSIQIAHANNISAGKESKYAARKVTKFSKIIYLKQIGWVFEN